MSLGRRVSGRGLRPRPPGPDYRRVHRAPQLGVRACRLRASACGPSSSRMSVVDAVLLRHQGSAGVRHLQQHLVGRLQRLPDGCGQRSGIAAFDKPAGAPRDDELRHTRDRAGDHHPPCGDGLHQHDGQPFGEAGQHDQPRLLHGLAHTGAVAPACQLDAAGAQGLAGPLLQAARASCHRRRAARTRAAPRVATGAWPPAAPRAPCGAPGAPRTRAARPAAGGAIGA